MIRHSQGSPFYLLLALVLSGGAVVMQAQQQGATTTMYVHCNGTPSVPVFSGNHEQIASLQCGQAVTVLGESGGWIRVVLPGGGYAFVSMYSLGKEREQVSGCPEGMTRVLTETGSKCRFNSAENARSNNPPESTQSTQQQQAAQPTTNASAEDIALLERANKFTSVFNGNRLTLTGCRSQISAVLAAPDEILQRITMDANADSTFDNIQGWLSECGTKLNALPLADTRRAIAALTRIGKWAEKSRWSSGYESAEQKRIEAESKQKVATDTLVANYNALINQYNTLVDSFNYLRGYAMATSAGYDQMKTQLQNCTYSTAVQQMINNLNAQRPTYVYTPPPQRVNVMCSTIDLGGIYSTSCQ